MEDETAIKVIQHIAKVSQVIARQAGVGAMETAGSIISFLAMHPEQVAKFMADPSVFDWPTNWHCDGMLSWHGADGKVHHPERPSVS